MARIPFTIHGATPFQKLLGYNQVILSRWTGLSDAFENTGKLSPVLKEQVRRTLAFGNGCEYCQAKGRPSDVQIDPQVAIAVGFAEIFLQNYQNLDDSIFDVLRTVFDDQEIAELCSYICFMTASQMFGAVMKLEAE
ncbi:carboxymuconolactone decarboxylase family protein [Brevibacillus sp. SIMBA_040]|uniref:carboxymuconolactone decarboxylase family protein n=1 Tax=unclassified Brevibacillus TaxID=2684853 RepID=UPI00397970D2